MRGNSISHILALLGGIGVLCSAAPASRKASSKRFWRAASSSSARAAPIRRGTSSTRAARSSASTSTWPRSSPRACSRIPEKIEFVTQASDCAHPEHRHRQGRHHLPVHDRDGGSARSRWTSPSPIIARASACCSSKDGDAQDLRRAEGGRRRRHRLGAAERLCRGHGASGAAGGDGRPVRKRRPHVSGAEFRPRRRGGDRRVVAALVHGAEPGPNISTPATPGTRRPIPAR